VCLAHVQLQDPGVHHCSAPGHSAPTPIRVRDSMILALYIPHGPWKPVRADLLEQDQTRSFLGASRTPPVRQYVQARGGTLDGHVARFDGGQLPVRAPGFTRRPRCVFDAPPAHH
jgi:hypothetical protein